MADSFFEDIVAVRSIRAIPTILDVVCRTTGMRFAAVARVTDRRWIACSVADHIAFGMEPGDELEIRSTLCHEVLECGRAIIIDHVAADPVYRNHHTPTLYGFQSYASMPIRLLDGSVFGTLCAIDPAPRALNTPETVAMFEMFADVIGFQLSGVDRVRLIEAGLREEREAAATREQFAAVLEHDMRDALATIGCAADLLVSMELPETAAVMARTIRGAVSGAAGVAAKIKDFSDCRLGDGLRLARDAAAPVDGLLERAIAQARAAAPGRVIETLLSLAAPVHCDRARLAQLVSNLLDNALAYGDPAQPIQVAAITTGNWLKLSVTNAGAMLPPVAMKAAFQPLLRARLGEGRRGLALGLTIAQAIARAHGGWIDVTSTPVETRFALKMPLGV